MNRQRWIEKIVIVAMLQGCGDGEARNRKKEKAQPDAPAAGAPTAPGEAEPPKAPEDSKSPADPESSSPPADSDPAPGSPDSAATGDSAAADDQPERRRFTENELMTLVGLSSAASQSAYGHCRDVLAQGIYNRYQESMSDTVKHALKERFCIMAEDEFAEKVQSYFNEQRSGSQSGSHDHSFGFSYMEAIGIEIGTAGSSSGSSSQGMTRAQALDTARKWKSSHCGERSSAQSSDFEHTVLSQQIDENVVAAWRACVAEKSHGFFCESSETDDTVSIHMRWDPNAVQASLLPRLSIRQQTAHNLKLKSTSVPETLGTGSGISITYERLDPKKPSVFEALGSDPNRQVDFHCSIRVSKVVTGHVKESPYCGIKEYKSDRGPVCGSVYRAKADKPCPVEAYVSKASSHCGVLRILSRADATCPGSITYDRQVYETNATASCRGDAAEPAGCPLGYVDHGVAKVSRSCRGRMDVSWTQVYKQARTCVRNEFLAVCAKPEFGIIYKTCAHKQHGVASYKTCRHPDFGVDYDKVCRHESFGKVYKTCFVPD